MALAAGIVAGLTALAPAGATAANPTSRLEGSFTMNGKVTQTKNVDGEKKGQKYTRTWDFKPACASGPCTKVKLQRHNTSGIDKLTLKWDGKSKYTSKRTVYNTQKCGGKNVKKALRSVVTITVSVTKTIDVNGVPVSTANKATFAAVHKVTCPGGTLNGSTKSSFTGTRDDVPEPPQASFDYNGPSSAPSTTSFYDDSEDPDGGKIVAWHWDFGDGGTATEQNPAHTFQSPGTYTVTLTVTDDEGQTGNVQRQIVIDPPSSFDGLEDEDF